jgi:hypothetical protein
VSSALFPVDASVIVALITAFVSLILTVFKIIADNRNRTRERRLAAHDRLEKYRAPLLASVDDLGRRLNNIRNDSFLLYLDNDSTRQTALLSTLFRVAQYLAWAEIVYGYSDRLRFESDEVTRKVIKSMNDISWVFASDKFDRTVEEDFTTSRLMLWREQQRAIGELMCIEGEEPASMSFDSFAANFDSRFARWFDRFAAELETSGQGSDRLAELHRVAARLVRELDTEKALVALNESGGVSQPLWATTVNLPEPTRHTDPDER